MAEIKPNVTLKEDQIHEMALKIAEISATEFASKGGVGRDDIITEFMATYSLARTTAMQKFCNTRNQEFEESMMSLLNYEDNSNRGIKF